MEYSVPVPLGNWRERVKRLSVPYARLSDNELVERARVGDVRSYEELVRRYERLVGRVIYPYAGREAAVEDLVQETFLRAYDRLDTFNPEYRFKTWLLAIANNLGIDALRRRRDVVEFNPEIHAPLTRGPEGLTYAEIAEVLGITVPALKSRLFRARNMLAGSLEGERIQGRGG